jgi:hypothetical protein
MIALSMGAPPTASALGHFNVADKASSVLNCSDPLARIFLQDIEKTRKQAAEYTPGLRGYFVQDFSDNTNIYLRAALSPSRRKEWLGKQGPEMAKCLTPALDELAAVARRTLPTYRPTGYAVRNASEERIALGTITDIASATVFKVGIDSMNWKIQKNNFDLPTQRYKWALIWAKYPTTISDDGNCRIFYVKISQDYAGGGTYGATYGTFWKDEYAGCPATRV